MTTPRVAIVGGLRTPFVKANSVFADLTALELGRLVLQELVERFDLPRGEIDEVVFGQVIPTLTASSIAREVVLTAGLPRSIQTHTVARACATSIQAAVSVAQSILVGTSAVGLAGGTESMSDPPIFTSRPLAHALVEASKARNLTARLKSFQKLKGRDLLPVPPAIAEHTTGLTMGESAEKMARENGISRQQQDELALTSHQRAAAAWKAGRFDDEVMHVHVPPRFTQTVAADNVVRADATFDALAALKPVFDRQYGTVTAGNSSPLTDGAAALILMNEEKARALGYRPLGFLRAWAFAATDPAGQLLQGPAYAAPIALDRAGLTLADLDLVELHEAFAAQVASNLQAFASKTFAHQLGRRAPLGEVDPRKLNPNGGSLALGHPFAATGARLIHQALRELQRRDGTHALVTVCAQGGLGAALVLERA